MQPGGMFSLPLMGIGNPSILHFFHAGLPLEGAQNAATTPKFALGATVTSSFALKRTHEPSENGPVFAVPCIFVLTHRSAESFFAKSLHVYVVTIPALRASILCLRVQSS